MKKKTTPVVMKRRHVFVLVGLVSALLLIGGYSFYLSNVNNATEEKHNEIRVISEFKINSISKWLRERKSDVTVTSQSRFFIEKVKELLLNQKNNFLNNEIKKYLFSIKEQYDYENIFIGSPQGGIILSAEVEEGQFDSSTISRISYAVNRKEITFNDFYFCQTHKRIHFDFIAPLKDEKENVIAVMVFSILPDDFLYPLIQSWPTPSKTSESLLIRKDGDSILFLNELRHTKNTALKLRISLTEKEVPAVQAVLGYKGIFEGIDYRRKEVLSYLSDIPGTEWFMVAKVDKNEIFSELYFRIGIIFAFILALILSSSFGIFWLYHYRQRNIYRELYQTQEEFKTTLHSIGDAVITTDIKSKVKYLNPIAEELTGWNDADARNRKLEKVFRIINEETKDVGESPVEKVLREGVVVGLANHTLLISKDGKEIPIADSGAPIKDENGNIIGVVLVFRDQTEEHLNQRLINVRLSLFEFATTHPLNELLTKTLDEVEILTKSKIGFYHFIENDQENLSLQAWSTSTEKDFCKAEGRGLHYKISEAGVWVDAIHQKKPVIHNDYNSMQNKKGMPEGHAEVIRELVVPIIKNDKIVAILGVGNKSTIYTQKDIDIVSYLADVAWEIAEKKRIDEKISYLAKRYGTIFSHQHSGILVVDENNRVEFMNRNYVEMFRLDEEYEKRIGLKSEDFLPSIISKYRNPNELIGTIKKFVEESKSVFDYEVELADGRFMLVDFIPIDVDGKNHGRMWIHRDITENKKAEKEILNLNRFYAMLSQSNQAIVRLKDKDNLLNEVCSIAIKYGGFKLAWIGLYDPEQKKIIPNVWAGEENGFLRNDLYSAPEEQLKLMPCFQAFCEDRIVVRNNVATDPDCEYWREAALGKGFKSLAATPIHLYKDILGVFVLYSSEAAFFGEKELKLLEEVGIDISFALETYDKERMQKVAEENLKESEERFRIISEKTGTIIYDKDLITRKIHREGNIEEILGYSKEEYCSLTEEQYFNLLHDEDREYQILAEKNIIKTGGHFTLFYRIKHKNGKYIFIEDNGIVISDKTGKSIRLLGSMKDVTERKLAEDIIKESERKYSDLYENSPDMLLSVDPRTAKIIQCNETLAKVTGYSKEELIGKSVRELYHPKCEEDFNRYLNQFRATGKLENAEMEVVKKNGSIINVLLNNTAVYDEDGNILHSRSVWRDITLQKKLESEEKRLWKILKESLNEIYIFNKDTLKFEFVNDGALENLGYTFEEIKQLTPVDIKPEFDEIKFKEALLPLFTHDKTVLSFETIHQRKDGTYYNVDVHLQLMKYGSDEIFVAIIQDITEKKKASEELKKRDIQFRKLSAQVPGMIYQFLKKPDGSFSVPYTSEGIREIFGCSPEDVLNDFSPIARAIIPEDLGMLLGSIEISAQELSPWYCEYRVQLPDNQIRWMSGQSIPEKLDDGSILWHGFNTDITEHKLLDKQIKESEEKYRSIVQYLPDAVIIHSQGKMLYANPQTLKAVGAESFEQIKDIPVIDFVHPDYRERVMDRIKNIMVHKTTAERSEEKFVKLNGEVIDVEVIGVPILYEGIEAVQTIVRDISERRIAEIALKESQERLDLSVKSAKIGLWDQNFVTGVITRNNLWAEMLGYRLEEIEADKEGFLLLIHPDDIPIVKLKMMEHESGKSENFYIEQRMKTKDNRWKWILNTGRIVDRDENGNPLRAIGAHIDIDEQKQAEEALRKSEEQFRFLTENMLDIVFTTDLSLNITYISKSVEKVLGFTPEERMEQTIDEMVTPKSKELILKIFYEEIEHINERDPNSTFTIEIEYYHKNGSIVIGETSVKFIRDLQGNVSGLYGVTRDITERKKVENALKENEKRFRSITNTATDAIIVADSNGKINYWNNSAQKIFGFSWKEVLGKDLTLIIPMNYRDLHLNGMKRYEETKQPNVIGQTVEMSGLKKDGNEFPIELSLSTWQIENNVFYSAIIRDITDRKKMTDELIYSKEKAIQADKLKSEFLAQMSHEIRTPINVIMSYTNMLKDEVEGKVDQDLFDGFDSVEFASTRIIRTIDLILNMAELQTGTYEPILKEFDIEDVVLNKLIRENKKKAESKGLKLLCQFLTDNLKIQADEYSITQIFANLIDNAIKYTNAGKVEVKVNRNKENRLEVQVKDSGIGISKEFLPNLFQPFTQEDHGYTRNYEGNGLGLALVKKYCEINNAAIEVESKKGVGTTFTVTFC